jgi:hypothetical protein
VASDIPEQYSCLFFMYLYLVQHVSDYTFYLCKLSKLASRNLGRYVSDCHFAGRRSLSTRISNFQISVGSSPLLVQLHSYFRALTLVRHGNCSSVSARVQQTTMLKSELMATMLLSIRTRRKRIRTQPLQPIRVSLLRILPCSCCGSAA